MEPIFIGIMLFITLGLGLFGFLKSRQSNQVEARISTLRSDSGHSTASAAAATALRGEKRTGEATFTERVIIPFAQTLSDRIQAVIPVTGKSWVRQKLVQSGYSKPAHLKTFLGVHCLSTLLPAGFVLFLILINHTVSGVTGLMLFIMMTGMGFALPLLWLIQQAGKRQESIRKALPDFLDLLVICVEAGLGLDIAISKISKIEAVKTSDYLREELLRYTGDIGFGKPRKEALLDLAARTGVDDLNSIVNSLVQSYEMGTGVVQALKVQSEGLRQRRLHRAEAAANKISVKMVLPIYMFFFPGIFIVILGPMILFAFNQIQQSSQSVGH